MSKVFSRTSEALETYVVRTFSPQDAVLRGIRESAQREGLPDIHVGSMDGLHLEVLVRALVCKKIVEIGTLAGFSGVCLARGLAKGGKLFTFEFEPKHAQVARDSFKRAGLEASVELFVGPALEQLPQIEAQGPFDLVFIDADKGSYPRYYEWAVKNLRQGGVILADNTFAGGGVASAPLSPRAQTLDAYNRKAATDPRVRSTIWPTSDGLTMSVKL